MDIIPIRQGTLHLKKKQHSLIFFRTTYHIRILSFNRYMPTI